MKTSRRALEHRLAFLVESGVLLGAGLPIDHALRRLARLAVPRLGDLCAIDLVGEDGVLVRAAAAHASPHLEPLAETVHLGRTADAATRARNAVLAVRPTAADVGAEAGGPEQARALERLRLRSWIVAPLLGPERALGVLTLATSQPRRRYDRTDLRVAVLVARQAAAAIEGERLGRAAAAARVDAEAATRARDEFLATLSHELRNPLNAALGWARLLEEGELSDAQQRRAVQIILRNVEGQARLVEDLLDLSTVVNGRMRLRVCALDLGDVIREVVEAMRPAADAKQLQLATHVDAPDPINGDPDRLRQVVWNLVANAVKFTPRGGRIEVTLRRAPSALEVAVADTGEGIPEAQLPHLFERLRQGDSSSTRRHGGVGIGLALVRHLVELHGGSVTAESTGEGRGATFTVRLPIPTSPGRIA